MQTKYLCVLIHIWIKGEVGALWNRFKPSSKIFYWLFRGGTSFVDLLCFCSVLCLLCLCARLFICTLWSPAGKGLTSWLSFVVSNCEFVTFQLVSWVRCGTWLYRFLIFAPLLSSSLLTEHHLEFLSLKGGCTGSSESTLVKCHIVGNHMSRLKFKLQQSSIFRFNFLFLKMGHLLEVLGQLTP